MKLLEKDILSSISRLNRDLPSKDPQKKSKFTNKNNEPRKKDSFRIVNNDSSNLDLFVETKGFNSRDFAGKSFSINKQSNVAHDFFHSLWSKVNNNNTNFTLIKNSSINGKTTWTKSNFEIKSENKISFSIKEEITSSKAIKIINKLHHILFSLESKSGKEVAKKYLEGFLEEKGMSYQEYIQYITA